MTTHDHERVSDLFLAACELPELEREPFLAARCGEDRSLVAHVLALLRQDARTVTPLGDAQGSIDPTPQIARLVELPSPPTPERIGDYRIVGVRSVRLIED
jgi:hypothetical protein